MKTLKLEKLILNNFGIFKDVELDFSNKDIVGILAEYANDKTRSNRSGKSLILEAIKYNLTGVVRSARAVQMIHEGEKVMSVTGLYGDSDGQAYTVRRGVDIKAKGVLELDWVEKSKESQAAIDALFGIGSDFEMTSFFNQGDIDGFMKLSPSKKSEYLMESMNLSHWQLKYDLVMADIKTYSDKLKENTIVKEAFEKTLEDSDDLNLVATELKSSIDRLKGTNLKLGKKLVKLQNELAEAKSEKKANAMRAKELKTKIQNNKKKREQAAEWKESITELKQANAELFASKTIVKRRDDLIIEINNYKTSGRQLSKKIKSIKENKGGICPILNEACDRITFSEEQLLEDEKLVKSMAAKLKKSEDLLEISDKNDEIDNEIAENNNAIDRVRNRLSNYKEVNTNKKDISEYKALVASLGTEELEEINEQIDAIEGEIGEIDDQWSSKQRQYGGITERLKSAKEALEQIDGVAAESEKLKTVLGDLRAIATMFSKNGIPAHEIENSFSTIEDECNMLLKELDYGPTLVFSPDRELGSWEPICSCGFVCPKNYRSSDCDGCGNTRMKQRKEEMSLKVLENGDIKDFNNDSGGGKLIVSFVVRLALTMYKRRQNKCKLNILFFDEIDSALDKHLASSITSAIANLLTKKLGFDQIFMISHKDEIKHSMPHILKVTRHRTHSTAAFL